MGIIEDRRIDKIKDDRDTALRLAKSFSGKLKIIAEHVCICGGRLVIKDGDLTEAERKSLSEFMEEYE